MFLPLLDHLRHLEWLRANVLSCECDTHLTCPMSCSGVYLLLKCGMLVERATVLMASARAIVRQEAAYGQYAKPEEVMESGNQCAICQVSICLLGMFSCFGMPMLCPIGFVLSNGIWCVSCVCLNISCPLINEGSTCSCWQRTTTQLQQFSRTDADAVFTNMQPTSCMADSIVVPCRIQ